MVKCTIGPLQARFVSNYKLKAHSGDVMPGSVSRARAPRLRAHAACGFVRVLAVISASLLRCSFAVTGEVVMTAKLSKRIC